MSGFDPIAAAAAQAVASAQQAIDVATLDLGTSADALRAQIRPGDLLEAIVLPPQNGTDRLSLFGKPIVAELPPGVHPGESLLLQVTAFSGTQIVVRNLGALDPLLPKPATVIVESAPVQESAPTANRPGVQPSSPQTSGTPTAAAAPLQMPVGSGTPAAALRANGVSADTSIAPPREVFVAASVKRILAGDVEARTQAPGSRISAERAFVERGDKAAPAPVTARNGAPLSLPAALLTRLRVPISASTLVAARMIDDAAKHVTSAYRRLDEALAKLPASDARIGTLRSLLAFTGKIDLRNGRVVPEQIAAFVAHVVDGAEGKIAQVVRALLTQNELPGTDTPASQEPDTALQRENVPAAQAETPAGPLAQSLAPAPDALARVTERAVALDHDVKAVMLSLLHDPPPGTTPQSAQALSNAIGATMALQLGVLAARDGDPNAISIPLPAYFFEGGKPAQLRISRDRNSSGKKPDADNFSVSFVLDTKTLGTVAIDLQTAQRAVSVSVKTERPAAAVTFRDTLSSLRDRLELLRYRVASMAADVARPVLASNVAAAKPPVAPQSLSNVDLRA